MHEDTALHKDLTQRIIHCFYNVYNKLGFGFLEKVYENAMIIELRKHGLDVESQKRINVFYEREMVGDYYADLVVNNLIILELKATESLCVEHGLQLLNYLRATELEVGLLLNFGKKPQVSRKQYLISEK